MGFTFIQHPTSPCLGTGGLQHRGVCFISRAVFNAQKGSAYCQLLEEKRREKSRLESELNQKRKELQDAKNELELVKQRLAE